MTFGYATAAVNIIWHCQLFLFSTLFERAASHTQKSVLKIYWGAQFIWPLIKRQTVNYIYGADQRRRIIFCVRKKVLLYERRFISSFRRVSPPRIKEMIVIIIGGYGSFVGDYFLLLHMICQLTYAAQQRLNYSLVCPLKPQNYLRAACYSRRRYYDVCNKGPNHRGKGWPRRPTLYVHA
jgi:hypothetical protein